MRSPVQLSESFRAQGLKLTPQRQLLFRLLHDNTSHPSAESLFRAATEQMPGISLRTVYQTLNDLVSMGELHQIDFVAGSARFDPNIDEHHHLVCEGCGDVRDIYLGRSAAVVGRSGALGLDGFAVSGTDIVLRGRCAACTAEHNGHPSPSTTTSTQGAIK